MERELIMSLLAKKGMLSLSEVCHIIHCKESNLILSLGQLIEEKKIYVVENNGRIFIESKSSLPSIYY